MRIRIYTDGACSGNQHEENVGGYGAILEYGEHVKEIYGGEENTTNNRMELKAVIEAFKLLKKAGLEVDIFSDSAYVVRCFRERWFDKWRLNGWRAANKEPVENKELWEELINFTERHESRFYIVKGHINPSSPNTNMKSHYDKFVKGNGEFSYQAFEHIVMMNNRADALANHGISECKGKLNQV